MKCKICGNNNNNQCYNVKEMKFGIREEFIYFMCGNCCCLQISEYPTDISKYYPTCFNSFQINPEDRVKNFVKSILVNRSNEYAVFGKDVLGRLFANIFSNSNLSSLKDSGVSLTSRVLDVGCGNGYDVYALKQIGFQNVLGVDAFISNDIKYKNGVKVIKGELYDVNGEWDIVMFHHSFEHLPDPQKVLYKASSLLVEGGMCLVRVPIVPCFAWEHYGVNWVQIDAPRHLFIHSKKSLVQIAERANLILEKIVYDSDMLQFYGSEQYLRNIPLNSDNSYSVNPAASPFTKSEIKKFKAESIKLNRLEQGDQASFYFRKRN